MVCTHTYARAHVHTCTVYGVNGVCMCFFTERLINIWAYHSGRSLHILHEEHLIPVCDKNSDSEALFADDKIDHLYELARKRAL